MTALRLVPPAVEAVFAQHKSQLVTSIESMFNLGFKPEELVCLMTPKDMNVLLAETFIKFVREDGDEHIAQQLMFAARKPAHIPILIGIIVLAAGIKKAMGHMYEGLPTGPSVALAGGVALYLLGDVWFRRIMNIGPSPLRLAAAVLALATIPLGPVLAELQVIVLVAILAGVPTLERRTGESSM